MTSKTSVLNGALVRLGQPPSAGPSDTSTWVKRCLERYDPAVRSLLEQHPWNFAQTVEELERLSETPVTNHDYAYNKPSKILRICLVNDTGNPDDNTDIDYEDRGGKIYASYDSVYMWFISLEWLTKEGSWPQVFRDAVSAEIASQCSSVATKNLNKGLSAEAYATKMLKKAKSFDASQKAFRELPVGKWVRSRRTGSRYNTEGH